MTLFCLFSKSPTSLWRNSVLNFFMQALKYFKYCLILILLESVHNLGEVHDLSLFFILRFSFRNSRRNMIYVIKTATLILKSDKYSLLSMCYFMSFCVIFNFPQLVHIYSYWVLGYTKQVPVNNVHWCSLLNRRQLPGQIKSYQGGCQQFQHSPFP